MNLVQVVVWEAPAARGGMVDPVETAEVATPSTATRGKTGWAARAGRVDHRLAQDRRVVTGRSPRGWAAGAGCRVAQVRVASRECAARMVSPAPWEPTTPRHLRPVVPEEQDAAAAWVGAPGVVAAPAVSEEVRSGGAGILHSPA